MRAKTKNIKELASMLKTLSKALGELASNIYVSPESLTIFGLSMSHAERIFIKIPKSFFTEYEATEEQFKMKSNWLGDSFSRVSTLQPQQAELSYDGQKLRIVLEGTTRESYTLLKDSKHPTPRPSIPMEFDVICEIKTPSNIQTASASIQKELKSTPVILEAREGRLILNYGELYFSRKDEIRCQTKKFSDKVTTNITFQQLDLIGEACAEAKKVKVSIRNGGNVKAEFEYDPGYLEILMAGFSKM